MHDNIVPRALRATRHKNRNFNIFAVAFNPGHTRNLPTEMWHDNAVSNTIMMSCKLRTLLAGTFCF